MQFYKGRDTLTLLPFVVMSDVFWQRRSASHSQKKGYRSKLNVYSGPHVYEIWSRAPLPKHNVHYYKRQRGQGIPPCVYPRRHSIWTASVVAWKGMTLAEIRCVLVLLTGYGLLKGHLSTKTFETFLSFSIAFQVIIATGNIWIRNFFLSHDRCFLILHLKLGAAKTAIWVALHKDRSYNFLFRTKSGELFWALFQCNAP